MAPRAASSCVQIGGFSFWKWCAAYSRTRLELKTAVRRLRPTISSEPSGKRKGPEARSHGPPARCWR
eukprot:scaffold26539_cov33-Tisochrysis_lutea.AAC.3